MPTCPRFLVIPSDRWALFSFLTSRNKMLTHYESLQNFWCSAAMWNKANYLLYLLWAISWANSKNPSFGFNLCPISSCWTQTINLIWTTLNLFNVLLQKAGQRYLLNTNPQYLTRVICIRQSNLVKFYVTSLQTYHFFAAMDGSHPSYPNDKIWK